MINIETFKNYKKIDVVYNIDNIFLFINFEAEKIL